MMVWKLFGTLALYLVDELMKILEGKTKFDHLLCYDSAHLLELNKFQKSVLKMLSFYNLPVSISISGS
jgi:hypothetical protein